MAYQFIQLFLEILCSLSYHTFSIYNNSTLNDSHVNNINYKRSSLVGKPFVILPSSIMLVAYAGENISSLLSPGCFKSNKLLAIYISDDR